MVSFEVDQIAEREKWENKGGYQSIYNRIIKRILGIALSLIVSIVVTPIILIIGAFIAA